MATFPLIAPTTSSKANTTNEVDTSTFTTVVVSAPLLAGAEEVDIYVKGPDGYAIFGIVGTASKLTASVQAIELPAGPLYAFAKDATVASAGVYITYGVAGT